MMCPKANGPSISEEPLSRYVYTVLTTSQIPGMTLHGSGRSLREVSSARACAFHEDAGAGTKSKCC